MRILGNKASLFLILVAAVLGCTRKTGTDASIRLDFSSFHAANSKASAINRADPATGPVISVIVINVSGPGISTPIFYQWNGNSNGTTSQPAPDVVTIPNVPSGDGRLIQALVVTKDSTGGGSFYYADVTQALSVGSQDVFIKTLQLGGAGVGNSNISGRYLKTPTMGPTGTISVYFQPVRADGSRPPKMLVDQTQEIFSGWFRVFGIEGQNMEYVTSDGTTLFNGPVAVDSSALQPTGTAATQSLRVFVPTYYSTQNGDSNVLVQQAHDRSVFGFFGPGASGKQICYHNIGGKLPQRFADPNGTTPINWIPQSTTVNATDAFVETVNGVRGGLATTAIDANTSLCTPGSGTYLLDFISLNDSSLTNGDEVLGFRGPFQILPGQNGGSSTLSAAVASGNLNFTWAYLPGVQTVSGGAPGIDGIDIFGRVEALRLPGSNGGNNNQDYSGNNDSVMCAQLTSLANPFTFLVNKPASLDGSTAGTASISVTASGVAPIAAAVGTGSTTIVGCVYSTDANGGKHYFGSAAVLQPGNQGQGQNGSPQTAWGISFPFNLSNPLTVHNNVCVPLTISALDQSGAPTNPLGPSSLTFTVPVGDGVYQDSNCFTPVPTPFAPNFNGSASATVYYKSVQTGSYAGQVISITDGHLPSASVTYSVANASNADTTAIFGVPASVMAFKCYPISYATVTASDGLPALYSTGYYMTPTEASGNVHFFSDPICQYPYSGQQLGGGGYPVSVARLYFSYQSATAANLSFSSAGTPSPGLSSPILIPSSNVQTPGVATKLNVMGPNMMTAGNNCMNVMIQLTDNSLNPSPLTTALSASGTVTLAVSNGLGVFKNATGNNNCSMYPTVTSITMTPDGTHTMISAWFQPTNAGTGTLTASLGSLTGSMNITVSPEQASLLALVFPGQTWTAGSSVITGTAFPIFINKPVSVQAYAVKSSNYSVDSSYVSAQSLALAASQASFATIPGTPLFNAVDNGVKTITFNPSPNAGNFGVGNFSINMSNFSQMFGLPSFVSGEPIFNIDPDPTIPNQIVAGSGFAGNGESTMGCKPLLIQTNVQISDVGYSFFPSGITGSLFTVSSITGNTFLNLYTDPTCSTLVGAGFSLLTATDSQALIYAKPSTTGTVTATINSNSFSLGSIAVSVQGNVNTVLSLSNYRFITQGSNAIALNTVTNVCTGMAIGSYDSNGNSVAVASAKTVTFSSSLGNTFYSDKTCSNQVTSVSFAAGDRAKMVYYKAGPITTSAATDSLTASDGTYTAPAMNVMLLRY